EQGLSPEEVVKRITDEDALRDRRQVAVMDARGQVAVYTGKSIISRNTDAGDRAHWGAWAGHALAPNISAQGNTLASEEVVKAMVRAYQNAEGEMVERLMAALEAGQSEGGDIRGMQSAGILIVRPFTDYPNETNERVWDIRVDDAVNPFKELRRVMNVRLSSRHTQRSAELAQAGKLAEAIAEQKKAVAMHPNNDGIRYTLAQRYAQAGEYLNALESLENAIDMQPRLKEDAARDQAFAKMSDMVEFKRLTGSYNPSQ
ncbi:MAG: tetratricopeptide repeat protein, partial [Gemmatimonadetes bacterium]|nr:tetratricopeptide repeat protein [Gemmatimonadota bacterium]